MQKKREDITLTDKDYETYAQLIGKFGTSQKGMRTVNGYILDILALEDTRDNRNWVRSNFRRCIPSNERFEDKYAVIIEVVAGAEGLVESRQDHAVNIDTLDDLIAKLKPEIIEHTLDAPIDKLIELLILSVKTSSDIIDKRGAYSKFSRDSTVTGDQGDAGKVDIARIIQEANDAFEEAEKEAQDDDE